MVQRRVTGSFGDFLHGGIGRPQRFLSVVNHDFTEFVQHGGLQVLAEKPFEHFAAGTAAQRNVIDENSDPFGFADETEGARDMGVIDPQNVGGSADDDAGGGQQNRAVGRGFSPDHLEEHLGRNDPFLMERNFDARKVRVNGVDIARVVSDPQNGGIIGDADSHARASSRHPVSTKIIDAKNGGRFGERFEPRIKGGFPRDDAAQWITLGRTPFDFWTEAERAKVERTQATAVTRPTGTRSAVVREPEVAEGNNARLDQMIGCHRPDRAVIRAHLRNRTKLPPPVKAHGRDFQKRNVARVIVPPKPPDDAPDFEASDTEQITLGERWMKIQKRSLRTELESHLCRDAVPLLLVQRGALLQ